MAAFSLHHSRTPLGNYLRRMKAKLGPEAATMATAHKIAVIFYTMIKNQVEYDETIWDARDAEREKRLEAKLKRQAKQLGYELVPIEPKARITNRFSVRSSLEASPCHVSTPPLIEPDRRSYRIRLSEKTHDVPV